MLGSPVRLERAGSIALILIDHPPLNALSVAVCEGLLAAIATVERTESLVGAVIAGEGHSFITGADMRAFDATSHGEAPASLLMRTLDACPKPLVVAMHGDTLGGGFEVALACHSRIIAPDGTVGLPEVRLGLLPGGGGTQRLPRLVGPLVALELLESGRPVAAEQAMTLGLVDEVATNPRAAALERARYLAESGHHPRVADRAIPHYDKAAWAMAQTKAGHRARGAAAPVALVEAIETALHRPFAEGLAKEQALFSVLRNGPQAAALRYLAHAEQVATRLPTHAGRWTVRRVGVIGGGAVGSAIAIAVADAGIDVVLAERDAEAAHTAEARVRAIYDRQMQSRRLGDPLDETPTGRIRYVSHLQGLREADLVIEAAPRDQETARAAFRALSDVVRRDTVLASTTMSVDIDLLADEVEAPERVIGLQFCPPAYANRMLEISRTRRSLPEAIALAQVVARRLHKIGVVGGPCNGFIGDRLVASMRAHVSAAATPPVDEDVAAEANGKATAGRLSFADLATQPSAHAALVNEAAYVLADGSAARPSDIDLILVHGYGYPAWRGGPLHEADTIGVPEILKRICGSGLDPAPLLRQMAEAGRCFADLNL